MDIKKNICKSGINNNTIHEKRKLSNYIYIYIYINQTITNVFKN